MSNSPHRDRTATILIRRYLPAEMVGTATCLLVIALCLADGAGARRAVICASWLEAVAFSAFMLERARRAALRHHALGATGTALRRVLSEFGVAEVADIAVLRPMAMLAGASVIGNWAGAVVGKFAADLAFYLLAAPVHLVRLRRRPVARSSDA